MKTVRADSKSRLRLPFARPGQVFTYEPAGGEGCYTVSLVKKSEPAEAFPRGSLKKYFTRANDREELARLKACVLGPE